MGTTSELKEQWEESREYRTLSQWLKVFPGAKSYLKEQYKELKRERRDLRQRAKRAVKITKRLPGSWFWEEVVRVFLVRDVKSHSKRLSRLRWALLPEEVKKETEITPEMIERAREFPIQELFERVYKKNWVKCPFHDDKDPSGYLKNNYFYCFGCGAQGDTIDLMEKIYGIDFKEAVKRLGI